MMTSISTGGIRNRFSSLGPHLPSLYLSCISGVLLVLIQPPISLYPVAFFALIPLLYAIDQENCRFAFRNGFVCGFVSFIGLVYWVVIAMNRYGGINIWLSCLILLLLVLYLSLYTGVFAFAVSFLKKRLTLPVYLSAPVVWVLLEYVRGFLFTGFPWSFLAHSQDRFLHFIQVVSITGTYFISFIIVAINCIIYNVIRRRSVSVIYVSVIFLLVAGSLIYGFRELGRQEEGTLQAAIIQGNIRQDVKWDEAFKIRTIRTYYRKTLEGAGNADLIIWPETAMPFVFEVEIYANKYIKDLPALLRSDLLFGTVSRDSAGRYHNSAYLIDRKSETVGVYSKVHLVPFGEYTPLVRYLPFLEKLTATGGDFFPGEGHLPLRARIGNIGMLICYEGIFPYITNETVRNGAQVLVNLTNDAWYERTSAPFQHLAFYVFRAIETDRFLLRSANTGISAVIDPKGRIRAQTPIFVETVLRSSFSLKDTKTFYVRYGDYFIVILCLALAVMCAVKFIMKRNP